MLKVKKTLLIFSLMLTINNLSFSEGKILKNELPKSEREFFEGGSLIDLQSYSNKKWHLNILFREYLYSFYITLLKVH